MQPTSESDEIGVQLGVALPAFYLHAGCTLTLARCPELGDQARLFELGECAGDLPHGDLERVLSVGEIVARAGEDGDASADQGEDAQFLGYQVAGEAARVLDDDDTHAIAFDAVQEGSEAGPDLDWVRATHCSVVELINQGVAVAPGEGGDGLALSPVAILIAADIF